MYFTAFPDLSLPFPTFHVCHCLSLTFHCLSLTFHVFHCLSRPFTVIPDISCVPLLFVDLSLPFPDLSYLPLPCVGPSLCRYLTQFSYSNATSADLWAALGAHAGVDVAGLMAPWTSQVGFPVLHIGDDGAYARPCLRCRSNRTMVAW